MFRGGSHAPEKPPTIFGIYSFGEHMAKLVDNRTRVPGGAGTFQWPGSFDQIAASGGIVVFRGKDADGKLGLYVVRQEGGRIRKIIAEGDPINGFTVADDALAIRKDSLSGNTLVFGVGYTNGGAGIYSTNIVLP